MTSLTPAEQSAARALITLALAEDVGERGDVTSAVTISGDAVGAADFVARPAGVVSGLPVVAMVLEAVDPQLKLDSAVRDGSPVNAGTVLARVHGPMRSLLTAERTALNFLQRLSGVATLTRRFADAVAGTKAKILDTRKTTPGWRLLEKYAVRCGGGQNHRVGLYDGVLIKDNHLAALGGGQQAVRAAVASARAHGPGLPVEVEVDSPALFEAALACRPDMILLDNMDAAAMRACVRRRDDAAPDVLLEASGGVTLSTVAAIAATGVDRISVGALTHSAPALDIALDYRTQS